MYTRVEGCQSSLDDKKKKKERKTYELIAHENDVNKR